MSYQTTVVIPANRVKVEVGMEEPKQIGEILLEKADELYPEVADELKAAIRAGQVRISK